MENQAQFLDGINKWAAGLGKAQIARDAAAAKQDGATLSLMAAGVEWQFSNENGKPSSAALRKAVMIQKDTVWSANVDTYGFVLKVNKTDEDGTTSVSLSGTAANALSIIRGAVENDLEIASFESFGELRKQVQIIRAAAKDEKPADVAAMLRTMSEAIATIRKEAAKIDDVATLSPIVDQVCAAALLAAATITDQDEGDAVGNLTGTLSADDEVRAAA